MRRTLNFLTLEWCHLVTHSPNLRTTEAPMERVTMAHNLTALVPTEAGTRSVEGSEQPAFREAQYAGSRDDHVIE